MDTHSTRRRFLELAALSAAAGLVSPAWLAAAGANHRAAALYAGAPIIDGLGFPGGLQPDENAALNEQEVADIAASGLAATHLTVGNVGTEPPLQAFEAIVRSIDRWEGEIDRHPGVLARVRSASDIMAARQAGRTGLIYGLQDGVAFEDEPDRLDALARFGIRIVQPTYNRRNLLGDGCMEPADAGLSRNGFRVVEKIHEQRLLLDLSHCGRRTAADAISVSKVPVSFTHTGCYALAEHPRHRSDEEIRAVAETGGLTGIFVMPYLARGRQPTASDVIRHAEHVIQVAGEDHVAIGTDNAISPQTLTEEYKAYFRDSVRKRREAGIAAPFETEEGYLFADDLNTPRRFETLAELLLERGHGEARVEKILGGNLMRVFGDVWGEGTASAAPPSPG